jgi:hypothetical protein
MESENLPNLTDGLLRVWDRQWIGNGIRRIRKSRVQLDGQSAAGRRLDRPQRRLPISVVEDHQAVTTPRSVMTVASVNHALKKKKKFEFQQLLENKS